MLFLLSIALVHLVASLSPGPDSLLTVRNSLRGGPRAGFATLAGILCGVAVQISLALAGITVVLDRFPGARSILVLPGAAFLIYLGIRSLQASSRPKAPPVESAPPQNLRRPLAEGFLTNILNPKAIAYFLSVFSLSLTPDLPLQIRLAAAILMIASQALGFAALIGLATALRDRIARLMKPLEALCGILFLLFAAAWLLYFFAAGM